MKKINNDKKFERLEARIDKLYQLLCQESHQNNSQFDYLRNLIYMFQQNNKKETSNANEQ